MRSVLGVWGLLLLTAPSAHAHGLLIPKDVHVPPLAMLRHEVAIAIEDQAALTRVEQTFRNHTKTNLEATYVFPVPRGASVSKFSMWLDGKETKGELVEAGRAKAIYTEAVKRTLEPGLLEYLGNDVLQSVFPVPAGKDLTVKLEFTTLLSADAGVVEYVYPLKTDGRATSTLQKFKIEATLKSENGVQSIYSPTHAVAIHRAGDQEVKVVFDQHQALLDKDFRLLYTLGKKDVGLAALTHRPAGATKGHFLLVLTPRAELPQDQVIPRDVVLVLDTSGSMAGAPIGQARNALKFVLGRLNPKDRFGIITFSDTVNTYGSRLWESTSANLSRATNWVSGLNSNGGTNINDALLAALAMRPEDGGRPFTIVFFTDGQPTTGITSPQEIVKNVLDRNTASTRIFTFGVSQDVNATLLDQLALKTRAASVYVRPGEDIETSVSTLYNKISQPVLVDLALGAGQDVLLEEMYPPKLPDLFAGGQVVVLGQYTGHGKAKLTLQGTVGKEKRSFDYEVNFPESTGNDRDMVETIWARRKIGFLLDQIRANGEQKELIDSTVALAKKYGIATPYTSYLIVPDAALPVVGFGQPTGATQAPGNSPSPAPKATPNNSKGNRGYMPTGVPRPPLGYGGNQGGAQLGFIGGNLGQFGQSGQIGNQGGQFGNIGGNPGQLGQFGQGSTGKAQGDAVAAKAVGQFGNQGGGQFGIYGNQGNFGQFGQSGNQGGGGNQVQAPRVADFARSVQDKQGALAKNRGEFEEEKAAIAGQSSGVDKVMQSAKQAKHAYDEARAALGQKQHEQTQAGRLGVDLSVQSNRLRDQSRLSLTPLRKVAGRNLLELGGAWIDEGYDASMPTFTIRALSPAYFRLLEKQPHLRDLFQLGNNLVWVTPNGRALVIDLEEGHESLGDKALDWLFERK